MNKYIPYNQCIIRTPLFPINYIDKIEDFELSIFQQSFKEAVYIATPVLYQELYIKNNINERTINSTIKYYVRSCTRCTPYGIFAGCDIVPIRIDDNYSNIIMSDLKNYKTYTRIDMNYLCELIRKLDLMPQIQNAITYHVNTTSYFLGKNLRYIEYRINKSKRNYTFSEISHTPYLNNIIKALKKTPLTKKEIIRLLIKNKEIEEEEALNFVQTLIDEQILISNLEPSVVGEDLIQQLHHNLSEINYNLEFINSLIYLLKECDKESLGNKESIINNIYRLLSDGMLFEQDTLMQVDTLNKVKQGIIGNNITKVIDKCIYFFSKFQPSHKSETFELFKRRFYEKYEEQEVPLVVALDPQVGIGYGNWTENNGDINPLLQGLPNPFLDRSYKIDMDLTPVTMLLIKKYEEAIKQGLHEIEILDEDLNEFEERDLKLPQCSVMLSVLSNDDTPSILLKGIIGGATSRLISRFEYLDSKIENFVNEINKRDELYYKDCIVAEVMHLPEDRIGNIQMHPNNRQYGICYLSSPTTKYVKKIIPIDNITISVYHGQEVILKSKKNKKRIIPMLSTAHNTKNGLPIYSFLSDYINQESMSYSFDWGSYFHNKSFLPRVIYSNVILKPARWLIHPNEFPQNKNLNSDELYSWKLKQRIPDEILITLGDNQLYINFNKEHLVKIFISELKKKRPIILEEFLYSSKNINLVESQEGFFANELIINLYKK